MHNPLDVTDIAPTPILLAALAPVMLRIAGELASGTILWMADERAIGEHVVPRITRAADAAGRPAPRIVAGVPVVLCRNDEVDGARTWANKVLGHAEYSPNYQRLIEHGDATDVGDICAAGDESAVVERLRSFRDAGATDLSVRVLPLGARSRGAPRVVAADARRSSRRCAPSSDPVVGFSRRRRVPRRRSPNGHDRCAWRRTSPGRRGAGGRPHRRSGRAPPPARRSPRA